MSLLSVKEKIQEYKSLTDIRMLKKLPLIIELNGRSFDKLTSKIEKPFSTEFMNALCATSLTLAYEIDGVSLIYVFNDEINIIIKQDTDTPWYDNKIQKIISAVSSIASVAFYKAANALNLNIVGEPVFLSQAYVVPNVQDLTNILIYKQQQANYTAISNSVYFELSKKYSKNVVDSLLYDTSLDEKLEILKDKCDIDFMEYPLAFKRGVALYRVPTVVKDVDTNEIVRIKNKWTIDSEIPFFNKNYEFIDNILNSKLVK